MQSMLVSNDFYTASSITWFLKFLSVSKVVRLSSGLSIFQMARLLQLLPTVTSELWPSYKLFIDIHGMNQDWNVKRELKMNMIFNFYVFSAQKFAVNLMSFYVFIFLLQRYGIYWKEKLDAHCNM